MTFSLLSSEYLPLFALSGKSQMMKLYAYIYIFVLFFFLFVMVKARDRIMGDFSCFDTSLRQFF